MKRPNPYPGVKKVVDRHGKTRWRLRVKRRHVGYIPSGLEYGSKEFTVAYEALLNGEGAKSEQSRHAAHGSFDWLIEHYLRTPEFAAIGPVYKRNLTLEFERFRREHGDKMVKDLRPKHIEALIAKKSDTPAAANKLLKLIRRLCRFAVRREYITHDPTYSLRGFKTNPDGYHTWSDAEIARFEAHHGVDSKAVLALRIMLYTGAAREDAAAMGWQNVKDGRILYRRIKTKEGVDIPIMDELADVLADVSDEQMLFVTHGQGRGYNPATFGNWFGDMCRDAGVPGRAHGLRKAGATRLANAGATESEIQAFLGHRSPNEARTYIKKANRAKLGDSGMAKLKSVTNSVERLDTFRRKELKTNGK